MKDDIIQIATNEFYLFGLSKSGKLYRIDPETEKAEWELVADSPKQYYKKAKTV